MTTKSFPTHRKGFPGGESEGTKCLYGWKESAGLACQSVDPTWRSAVNARKDAE